MSSSYAWGVWGGFTFTIGSSPPTPTPDAHADADADPHPDAPADRRHDGSGHDGRRRR